MVMKCLFFIFLLFSSIQINAQIKGLIKDSVSNEAIPFVNFQALKSSYGTNSNQKGEYNLRPLPNDSFAISAIGYQSKKIAVKDLSDLIYLKPITYAIPEVEVDNQTEEIELGRVKKQIFSWGKSAMKDYPYMVGRYFEYEEAIANVPYIKSISVLADSKIDSALFNVRIYTVDSLGLPKEPLVNRNLLIYATRGNNFIHLDIEKDYLKFPKEGLFVAVEWLQIQANEYRVRYKDSRTKKRKELVYLQPSFATESNPNRGDLYTYYNGKWKKHQEEDSRMLQLKLVLRN